MATFQTRVESLIGTISSPAALNDWLTAGARYLLSIGPSDKLLPYASTASGQTQYSLFNKRMLSFTGKNGTMAIPVSMEIYGRASDSTSLFYADSLSGYYTIQGQNLLVTSVNNELYYIAYPSVAYTDSTIAQMPEDWQHGVVLYSCVQATIYFISTIAFASLTPTVVSFVAVPPSPPTLAPVIYTDAISAFVTPTTINSIPDAPVYVDVASLKFGNIVTMVTALDTALITNEDIELAQGHLIKIEKALSEYQILVSEHLGAFNKDLKKFDAEVQKVITQSQITAQEAAESAKLSTDINIQNELQAMTAIIQNNNALLQKYQTEVMVYTQRVNEYSAQVQHSIGELSAKVQRNIEERNKYQLLLQSLKNEFNLFLQMVVGVGIKEGQEQNG